MSATKVTPSPYAATDCHSRPSMGCACSDGNTWTRRKANVIAKSLVPAVVAFLVERTGGSPEDVRSSLVFSAPGHERPNAFGIAYEGDYEWTIYASSDDGLREVAARHGLFIEPNNGWCLGVHPA